MQINIANKFRIYAHFRVSKLAQRKGVCSINSQTEMHMLLWDFDENDLHTIGNVLSNMIYRYELPTIYILESSKNHYHAYCFCSRFFQEIIHILSGTYGIDVEYLRLGMVRGYYTLRFTEKSGIKPKLVEIIESKYPNEMSPTDVTINEYLTTNI